MASGGRKRLGNIARRGIFAILVLHPNCEDHSPDLPCGNIQLSVYGSLVARVERGAGEADHVSIHSIGAAIGLLFPRLSG